MQTTETLTLSRIAKKAGGDRYENAAGDLTLYIPQRISRENGIPIADIEITFKSV
jgi:hypothetical protein